MHHFLAATLRELGELEEAERHFRIALDQAPDYLDVHYSLAELLSTGGRLEEAEAEFRIVLATAPRFVPAQVGLAHVLQSLDRAADAIEVIEQAREQAPDHPMVKFTRRLIYSNAVPGWHLPMINDFERNDAYRHSLERAVTPDSLVLEIGTGSGIVAMMAARAGAKKVVTCEVNPILARVAKETVARNGYAGRIDVVPRLSTQLTVGEGGDLPEKADVFVSELINIGMLAPRMLSVLQHARTHLVKPGGAIIPRASTVYAMLVETPELARINPVETVDGFDMGSFDVFRSPGYQQIDLGADAHTPLSRPFTALEFDFTRNMPEEGERVIDVTVVTAGTCHGIAFWFDLFMDEEVVLQVGKPVAHQPLEAGDDLPGEADQPAGRRPAAHRRPLRQQPDLLRDRRVEHAAHDDRGRRRPPAGPSCPGASTTGRTRPTTPSSPPSSSRSISPAA